MGIALSVLRQLTWLDVVITALLVLGCLAAVHVAGELREELGQRTDPSATGERTGSASRLEQMYHAELDARWVREKLGLLEDSMRVAELRATEGRLTAEPDSDWVSRMEGLQADLDARARLVAALRVRLADSASVASLVGAAGPGSRFRVNWEGLPLRIAFSVAAVLSVLLLGRLVLGIFTTNPQLVRYRRIAGLASVSLVVILGVAALGPAPSVLLATLISLRVLVKWYDTRRGGS